MASLLNPKWSMFLIRCLLFAALLMSASCDGCGPKNVAVACAEGTVRALADDLCHCFLPNDVGPDPNQQIVTLKGHSIESCDPFDTFDTLSTVAASGLSFDYPFGHVEDGVGFVLDGTLPSEAVCVTATSETRLYVERDATSCSSCDCSSFGTCVPAACENACGTSRCADGQTCLADGACATCGLASGEVQCGPDCGPCPGGEMCYEGFCILAFRCNIEPSSLCAAPKWCPVLSDGFAHAPGEPCFCVQPGTDGTGLCSRWNGSIDSF